MAESIELIESPMKPESRYLNMRSMRWFSEPQATLEMAQALYHYDLFNPAGVFRTPDGRYVLGLLRMCHWTPTVLAEIAKALFECTGNILISVTGPLIHNWQPIEPGGEAVSR